MRFPNRDDYKTYFLAHGVSNNQKNIWDDDELVIATQRHWHTRGQNGCVFAQVAATHADKYGWESKVLRDGSYTTSDASRAIDQIFDLAVKNQCCENLSLLFPQIDTPDNLVGLLKNIRDSSSSITVTITEYKDFSIVALRGKLDVEGVLAWIVGFGPFGFLPYTRQAPFTELAIRPKKKPETLFDKLNQDKEAAHLADLPLGLEYEVMDKLWEKTQAITRAILGNSARKLASLASVEVTYAIPHTYWKTT